MKKEWTAKWEERLLKFVEGDDLDFYEEYVMHLPEEEQQKFFEENPDFLKEFPISGDRVELLKDEMFREVLRKIIDKSV